MNSTIVKVSPYNECSLHGTSFTFTMNGTSLTFLMNVAYMEPVLQ